MKNGSKNKPVAALLLAATALSFSAHDGRCANPLYPDMVTGAGALGYYRFNDSIARDLSNLNSGTLGAAGNASNDLASISIGSNPPGVVYSMPGAIVGDPDRAEFFDYTTRT